MSINTKVVCHADGNRCHGCDHYYGRAPVCVFAPRAEQQGTPTPRTDANLRGWSYFDVPAPVAEFTRQLERELSSALAEVERLREALHKVADGLHCHHAIHELAVEALATTRQESSNG